MPMHLRATRSRSPQALRRLRYFVLPFGGGVLGALKPPVTGAFAVLSCFGFFASLFVRI